MDTETSSFWPIGYIQRNGTCKTFVNNGQLSDIKHGFN